MKSMCLILPFFGSWPPWLNHFLQTCRYNPTVDWLLYSDCERPDNLPANVRFVKAGLSDFNLLASRQLGMKISIDNPYKLCDLKPAYGVIFENFIRDHDFWGHTDLDIVYGNIRKFITNDLLQKHDIISTRKEYIAGHFTVFRNIHVVNSLYAEADNFEKIFLDKKLCFFDECGGHCEELLQGRKLPELNNRRTSMTHLVIEKNRRNIKIFFTAFAQEDRILEVYENRADWEFLWSAGTLVCGWDRKEVMYLHLLSSKKDPAFVCSPSREKQTSFHINRRGIFFPQVDGRPEFPA